MLKMTQIFNKLLIRKKLLPVGHRLVARSVYDINFDREEEIMQNVLGQVLMIGINLPDTKNVLNESALRKLSDCIEDFDRNEKMSVAILHGCNGNFCAGAVSSEEAEILCENLLKRLNELKKPIIGSLEGHATNFGAYLAIMCDMRVMDEACVIGYSNKKEDFKCPPFIYERLLANMGLSRTLEFICTRKLWCAKECEVANFASEVDCGCALGKSLLLAQSIAFHRPLKSIIQDRSKIFSLLTTKT